MEQKTAIRKLSFTVTCTEEEYRSAYRMVQRRVGVWRFFPYVLLFSLLILVCGSVLLSRSPFSVLWLIALVLLVLLPLVVYGIYGTVYVRSRIRHYWHTYREFGLTKSVNMYYAGMVISTKGFRLQMPFGECRCVVNRPDFLLLIRDRRCFVLIPKRDIPLEDPGDLLKFIRHGVKKRSIYD